MIRIHEPVRERAQVLPDAVRFSCLVETAGETDRTKTLWIEVPEALGESVSTDVGDGWLLATLPFAFLEGEEIQLDVPVDAELFQNALEIQQVWKRWYPKHAPVVIKPAGFRGDPARNTGRVGAFFSGGADAFFTVIHHDDQAKQTGSSSFPEISDLLHVWGFDLGLDRREQYAAMVAKLSAGAAGLGKRLICVATNFRETAVGRCSWPQHAHGNALGFVAHVLSASYDKMLISSDSSYEKLVPWGHHPITTFLMSGRSLRMQTYGAGYARTDKLLAVGNHPVVRENLHVCWESGGAVNCGRCEKCLRTWLALELFGYGEGLRCFPAGMSPDRLREVVLKTVGQTNRMADVRDEALKRGRADISRAAEECLQRSRPKEPRVSMSAKVSGFARRSMKRALRRMGYRTEH